MGRSSLSLSLQSFISLLQQVGIQLMKSSAIVKLYEKNQKEAYKYTEYYGVRITTLKP